MYYILKKYTYINSSMSPWHPFSWSRPACWKPLLVANPCLNCLDVQFHEFVSFVLNFVLWHLNPWPCSTSEPYPQVPTFSFGDKVLLGFPGWPQTWSPPALASGITGIKGVSCHIWLLLSFIAMGDAARAVVPGFFRVALCLWGSPMWLCESEGHFPYHGEYWGWSCWRILGPDNLSLPVFLHVYKCIC